MSYSSTKKRIKSVLRRFSPRQRVKPLIQDVARSTGLAPATIRSWVDRIEAVRSKFAADQTLLDAWDRPWLRRSPELQEKLHITNTSYLGTQMTVSTACAASKSVRDCLRLFEIVAKSKPFKAIEMGTNIGISGAYICAAMETVGNGKLITMEGSEPKIRIAHHAFEATGLMQRVEFVVGDFDATLTEVVAKEKPIDLAFVDGFHDGDATLEYFDVIKSGCSPNATLVFDDIDWSDGMRAAWNKLRESRAIASTCVQGTLGVCTLASAATEGVAQGDCTVTSYPNRTFSR